MNGSRMISLKEDEKTGIIYRQWTSSSPKAVILLVHGLGAHSGRWQFLADFLSASGVSSYALELKGFGQTKELKGHADSLAIYLSDIVSLYQIACREHPDRKIFILGESFGGLLAFLLSVRKPGLFQGLISISPAFRSRLEFSVLDYLRIAVLLFVNPKKRLPLPFDSKSVTRDEDYQKVMDANESEHRTATPKLLFNIAVAQLDAALSANRLKVPALFLLAGDDKLVDPNASRDIFKAMNMPDKKIMEYPGMYHALSIELGKEKVFSDIAEWVLKRV